MRSALKISNLVVIKLFVQLQIKDQKTKHTISPSRMLFLELLSIIQKLQVK